MATARQVDQSAIRFNQVCIIVLTLLAFLLQQRWLVTVVGIVIALGAVWPSTSLFRAIYTRLLRPTGVIKPRVEEEDPAGPLFAQGMGAIFLLAASGLFFLGGSETVGWILMWVVTILAGVNFFLEF